MDLNLLCFIPTVLLQSEPTHLTPLCPQAVYHYDYVHSVRGKVAPTTKTVDLDRALHAYKLQSEVGVGKGEYWQKPRPQRPSRHVGLCSLIDWLCKIYKCCSIQWVRNKQTSTSCLPSWLMRFSYRKVKQIINGHIIDQYLQVRKKSQYAITTL